MTIPVFRTDHLLAVELKSAHTQVMLGILNSAWQVACAGTTPQTVESVRTLLSLAQNEREQPKDQRTSFILMMQNLKDGDPVGMATAVVIDGIPEIGLTVHLSKRGRGMGNEIAYGLTAFCLERFNTSVVRATCALENIASASTLMGNGFEPIGARGPDVILFEVTRDRLAKSVSRHQTPRPAPAVI